MPAWESALLVREVTIYPPAFQLLKFCVGSALSCCLFLVGLCHKKCCLFIYFLKKINNRSLLLTVWRLGSPRSRNYHGCLLVRSLLVHSWYHLIVSSHGRRALWVLGGSKSKYLSISLLFFNELFYLGEDSDY